jgi:hypothetical protein
LPKTRPPILELGDIIHREKLLFEHFQLTIWSEIERERLIRNYENLSALQKDRLLKILHRANCEVALGNGRRSILI